MPIQNNAQIITLTAGGGTINLPTVAPVTLYIIQGTATLTSNWTIQSSGTPVVGMLYSFRYEAEITPDGNTITVFGRSLPSTLYDKTHIINVYWDGTNWEPNFVVDVDENGSIPSSTLPQHNFVDADAVGFVMGNGKISPLLVNAVQAECETQSEFKVRANINENFIELVGNISLTLDETAVVGGISPNVMSFNSESRPLDFRIPILFGYYDLTAFDVNPSSYIHGVLEYDDNFSPVKLHINASEIGSSTNAVYTAYINLKLFY